MLKARHFGSGVLAIALGLVPACSRTAGAAASGSTGGQPAEAAALTAHELRFDAGSAPSNPFEDVNLTVRFSGPGGRSLGVPGFYDGGSTWAARLAAPAEGDWSYTTSSNLAALDGRTGTVRVGPAPAGQHGGLRVDPANHHSFQYEDGTPAFVLGHEADWLWAPGLGDPGIAKPMALLDHMKAAGFSQVSVNIYALDTQWCPGRGKCGNAADDYGPPHSGPWASRPDGSSDYARLNLDYWQNLDRVVAYASSLGITVNLEFQSWNKGVAWPARRSREDDLYFNSVVAHLSAYNVTWDFSKETYKFSDPAYVADRMSLVGNVDPYHRLRTANQTDETWSPAAPARPWQDFYSDQNHTGQHGQVLRQRAKLDQPILVQEYGYEFGPGGQGDVTFGGVAGQGNVSADEMARRALEIITAGGYPGYYYAYSAWDVVRPDEIPAGYSRFGRIAGLMRATRFWQLEPLDELVSGSGARALARPGSEYVVYLPNGGTAQLTITSSAGQLPVHWVNVSSGAEADSAPVSSGTITLAPPAGLGSGILLVHVGAP